MLGLCSLRRRNRETHTWVKSVLAILARLGVGFFCLRAGCLVRGSSFRRGGDSPAYQSFVSYSLLLHRGFRFKGFNQSSLQFSSTLLVRCWCGQNGYTPHIAIYIVIIARRVFLGPEIRASYPLLCTCITASARQFCLVLRQWNARLYGCESRKLPSLGPLILLFSSWAFCRPARRTTIAFVFRRSLIAATNHWQTCVLFRRIVGLPIRSGHDDLQVD